MGFKKPFCAVPIRLGAHHQAKRRGQFRLHALKILGIAVGAGVAIGGLAALGSNGGFPRIGSAVHAAAASQGLVRANDPPPGAYYSGCNEARAAGVAPLYAGEPGYRPGMDGDGDGIACEPYRGR